MVYHSTEPGKFGSFFWTFWTNCPKRVGLEVKTFKIASAIGSYFSLEILISRVHPAALIGFFVSIRFKYLDRRVFKGSGLYLSGPFVIGENDSFWRNLTAGEFEGSGDSAFRKKFFPIAYSYRENL